MNNFGIKQEYIENIIGIIKNDKKIICAKIFGSRAIGDYRYNSDIDIALYSNTNISANTILELEDAAGLYKVDVIVINEIKDSKFIKEIESHGIEIYKR